MVWLLDNLAEMERAFTEVAFHEPPLTALLLAIGTLLIVFSMAVLGYLALGAAVEFVTPGSIGRPPERRV